MNITAIAMSLLTPAVVARIATALGINPSIAQMAINAALPAILGALVRKAAHPAGLGALAEVLDKQSPGTLGHLGELIGGSNQANLVSAGSGALATLFGGSTTNALAAAVGKFAGVPAAASTGLLGMLAPVALGTIAQQQQAGGLDASGLAKLLAGQQDNIAAALPAGFSELLAGTGLLDGAVPAAVPVAPKASSSTAADVAADALKAATTAAATSVLSAGTSGAAAIEAMKAKAATALPNVMPDVAATATATVIAAKPAAVPLSPTIAAVPAAARPPVTSAPAAPIPSGGGIMRWLLPLAAVLVLGVMGWYLLGMNGAAAPNGQAIIFNNVDVGSKSQALYERLKTTVSGIKDDASATASLPRLKDASAELGDLRDMARTMPDAARKSLSGLFATLAPGIQGLAETAIKAAGPESAAKPVLEQVVRRMKALAQN